MTPEGMNPAPIAIDRVDHAQDGYLLEASLRCGRESCRAEYPLVHGVPVVVRDLQAWWDGQYSGALGLVARIPPAFARLEAMTKRCQEMNALVGTYLEAHYDEGPNQDEFWPAVLEMIDRRMPPGAERALDLGCGVGRLAFELGWRSSLVIGLDSDLAYLIKAAEVQRAGQLTYGVRRWDTLYQTKQVTLEAPESVVFVAGDALDPPFAADSFDLVTHLNLVDAVSDPLMLIGQVSALLREGGSMVGCSPYEWQDAGVGFSRLSHKPPHEVMQAILENQWPQWGLNFRDYEAGEIPWRLRQGDRHETHFRVHLFAAQKSAATAAVQNNTKLEEVGHDT